MNDKFLSYIQGYQYVSFDIYDTLIYRTVSAPSDVFDIVEALYCNHYSKIKDFKKHRIAAEQSARHNNPNGEVNILDIYNYMPYGETAKSILIQIEEEVEIRNAVKNRCMVDILNECRIRGQKIVMISDMYLSRATLTAILDKLQIACDYLFISCEENATKHSGRLFEAVLCKLGIDASQIVHIGDNAISDIARPSYIGIRSIERIENGLPNVAYLDITKKRSITFNHLKSLIAHGMQNSYDNSSACRIGYSVLGPFVTSFCKWAHQEKERLHLNSMLFVSREGYLLKKAYDILYPEDHTEYISLNKNVLRLPLLSSENSRDMFIRSLPKWNRVSWRILFDSLYIEDHQKVVSEIKSHIPEFNYDQTFDRRRLIDGEYDYVLDLVRKAIYEDIKEQSEILIDYIKQIDILDGHVGLINNSLNGNGQFMIKSYLKNLGCDAQIHGLQFTNTSQCIDVLHDRFSCWMDSVNVDAYKRLLINDNALLLEHLLFEPVGTALYLKKDDLGTVQVVQDEVRNECQNFFYIERIQNNVLQFVETYKDNLDLLDNTEVFRLLYTLFSYPMKDDAILLSSLQDDDVHGDMPINNLDRPFKCEMLRGGKTPTDIRWMKGYLAAKSVSPKIQFMYRGILKYRYFKRFIKTNLLHNTAATI